MALSPRQELWARTYAETNNPVYAAEVAGYAFPTQMAATNKANGVVMARRDELALEKLRTDGVELAVDTLMDVARNSKNDNARVSAAKGLMGAYESAKLSSIAKEAHEMTAEERRELIARLRAEDAEASRPRLELSAEPSNSGVMG